MKCRIAVGLFAAAIAASPAVAQDLLVCAVSPVGFGPACDSNRFSEPTHSGQKSALFNAASASLALTKGDGREGVLSRINAVAQLTAEDGLQLALSGDNIGAQQIYRKVLLEQNNDEVARYLAVSLAISGDTRGMRDVLEPLLSSDDKANHRTYAFALAILGRVDEAGQVANRSLPKELSTRLVPYLRYISRLTNQQKAYAALYGAFPRAKYIGRIDPDREWYRQPDPELAYLFKAWAGSSEPPKTPSEQMCIRFGFVQNTSPFAECLLRLEVAKNEAAQLQQQYQIQKQFYDQQLAAYEAQKRAAKEERDRQRWMALARFGAGMASSRSPSFAGAMADGNAAMLGLPPAPAPVPPTKPASQSFTIHTPRGAVVTCVQTGSSLFCN